MKTPSKSRFEPRRSTFKSSHYLPRTWKQLFGFTLVEILGAVAIASTLAVIGAVSVGNTVTAGERAAIQRELQGLNVALAQFRSAGGTMPENATAAQAIEALMVGANLAGSTVQGLPNPPPLERNLGGTTYLLSFDSRGFSYIPGGEQLESVYGASGASIGVGMNGIAYAFDITDKEATALGIEEFLVATSTGEDASSLLEAINAAFNMRVFSIADLNVLENQLYAAGWIRHEGEWIASPYAIDSPQWAATALSELSTSRQDEDYALLLSSLSASSKLLSGTTASQIRTALRGEFLAAVSSNTNKSLDWGIVNFSGFNLSNQNLTGMNLSEANLSGATMHGVNLVGASLPQNLSGLAIRNANLSGQDLSGRNLAGFDWHQANMTGVNLVDAILPSRLSARLVNVNFAGRDLSNINLNGSSLGGANLAGTKLPPLAGVYIQNTDLTKAILPSNLANAQLSGSNLTGQNLSGANLYGANLQSVNLVGVTLPANLSGASLRYTNLAGVNLAQFTFIGSNLYSANMSDVDLTGAILPSNLAARLDRVNFSGWDLSAINLRRSSLGGANLSGAILPSSISGVYFIGTDLRTAILPTNISGAILQSANLANMDLSDREVRGTNFQQANLSGTTLPTNLSGANFRGVNLVGQNFYGFNLAGTSFYSANIPSANFVGGRVDSNTIGTNQQKGVYDANGNGTWNGRTVANWIVQ